MATSSDAQLGAIRLAWWRERLDELDQGTSPAEPRLQAVAHDLLPRSVSGHELTQFEDAWQPLLAPFPWSEAQVDGLALRGRILFGVGARLLGCSAHDAEAVVGAFWSIADGAQHCSDAPSRQLLATSAGEALTAIGDRPPRKLRPLTVIAALAAADLLHEAGGLARLSTAVRHRLTGRMPRS